MNRQLAPLGVWLVVAALMPVTAFAQQAGSPGPEVAPASVRRPYRGLFGGPTDPTAPKSLVFTASIYAAYDDNIFANDNTSSVGNTALQRRGYYSGAQAGLDYSMEGTRGSFGASGGSQVRYYQDSSDFVPSYYSTVRVATRFGQNTSVSAGYRLVYAPSFQMGLFENPTGTDNLDAPVDLDLFPDLFSDSAFRHSANLSITQKLGRRSSLSAGYVMTRLSVVHDASRDFRSEGASAGYQYQATAHLGVHLGYGYRTAHYAAGAHASPKAQDINAGVDYSRALSLSRRTFLTFATGSTILADDRISVPDSSLRSRFRLTGSAELRHEMGRTWIADLAYHRGLIFRDNFAAPFFADGVHGTLDGFITRRVDFSALAQWTHGSLASGAGNANSYRAVAANAQIRYGLNAFLALYARYSYYQHDFNNRTALDPQLPGTFDRSGYRVGVTTYVPLIR
jgi:hypothetical protein